MTTTLFPPSIPVTLDCEDVKVGTLPKTNVKEYKELEFHIKLLLHHFHGFSSIGDYIAPRKTAIFRSLLYMNSGSFL